MSALFSVCGDDDGNVLPSHAEGYGDYSPNTALARVFSLISAVFGLVMTAVMLHWQVLFFLLTRCVLFELYCFSVMESLNQSDFEKASSTAILLAVSYSNCIVFQHCFELLEQLKTTQNARSEAARFVQTAWRIRRAKRKGTKEIACCNHFLCALTHTQAMDRWKVSWSKSKLEFQRRKWQMGFQNPSEQKKAEKASEFRGEQQKYAARMEERQCVLEKQVGTLGAKLDTLLMAINKKGAAGLVVEKASNGSLIKSLLQPQIRGRNTCIELVS